MKEENQIESVMRNWYRSRLAVILESIVIGFLCGFVIVLFRITVNFVSEARRTFYHGWNELPQVYKYLLPFALALLGLMLGYLNHLRPMIAGGGVSQIKGALGGKFKTRWKSELPLKFIASVIAIGSGMSFGWEGPSVMLGAYAGIAVLSLLHRPESERKILITSASAAGLSAAFNAPLAGVIFALEEFHISMAPLSIACAMGASMTADAVAGHFFGLKPIYHLRTITVLPVYFFQWALLLGIICAFLGDIFKKSLYASQDIFNLSHIPKMLRPILPILLSIPLSLYLYEITGSGHDLIDLLAVQMRPIKLLCLFLIVKLLYTSFCFGSGASGGIFLPFLSIGALAGDIFGKLLTAAGFIPVENQLNFMILGMAATFSAVVKTPVTAIVLVLEITGNYNHLACLVLVCLSSFVTAELLKSHPVYDVLLFKLLRRK